MELTERQINECTTRLLLSRARLLTKHSFYGLLLMHMRYGIDPRCDTAYTDGERIAFNPEFLYSLTDGELDFVMMHEILHVVLMHCKRGIALDPEIYNIACDIVVNSNILKSENMRTGAITLSEYGEAMHIAPDGEEGYIYTAEEVYEQLVKEQRSKRAISSGGKSGAKSASDSQSGGKSGAKSASDSQSGGEKGQKSDQNENDKQSPDEKAGRRTRRAKGGAQGRKNAENGAIIDSHHRWGEVDERLSDVWAKRVSDVVETLKALGDKTGAGDVPVGAQRALEEIKKPRVDWRQILCEFCQDDITDYSFSPPDRRFSDSPFFLPDFSELSTSAENLLFMVDTSGSVSDEELCRVYSELCGAIDSLEGRLSGYLGFFDAAVYDPAPFCSKEELLRIKPRGGGGTSFHAVFKYVSEKMADDPPKAIIILTDGDAEFPPEDMAGGIPVLWMMTTEAKAPFGKSARIEL